MELRKGNKLQKRVANLVDKIRLHENSILFGKSKW